MHSGRTGQVLNSGWLWGLGCVRPNQVGVVCHNRVESHNRIIATVVPAGLGVTGDLPAPEVRDGHQGPQQHIHR